MGPTDGATDYAKRGTYQALMVEMLPPIGFKLVDGPWRWRGPSRRGGLRGEGRGSSRRSPRVFEEKVRGLLRTQQRLDSVNVLGEGWQFPCGSHCE
nr:hypothetical protein [Tanacetum cinerariifolium]